MLLLAMQMHSCAACAAACKRVARAAVLNTLLTLLQSHVSELTRGLAATALAFHPDQPLLALVSWRVLARGHKGRVREVLPESIRLLDGRRLNGRG